MPHDRAYTAKSDDCFSLLHYKAGKISCGSFKRQP